MDQIKDVQDRLDRRATKWETRAKKARALSTTLEDIKTSAISEIAELNADINSSIESVRLDAAKSRDLSRGESK